MIEQSTTCPFGGYSYEMGYCVRDAFRQHYGSLPVLRRFPRGPSLDWLRDLCHLHGWPYVLPGPTPAHVVQWSFAVGEPIIWLAADDTWGDNLTGHDTHATYATDLRSILDACERYQWHITGWIEIGKGKRLSRLP